jgi:hypothetical protein
MKTLKTLETLTVTMQITIGYESIPIKTQLLQTMRDRVAELTHGTALDNCLESSFRLQSFRAVPAPKAEQ